MVVVARRDVALRCFFSSFFRAGLDLSHRAQDARVLDARVGMSGHVMAVSNAVSGAPDARFLALQGSPLFHDSADNSPSFFLRADDHAHDFYFFILMQT